MESPQPKSRLFQINASTGGVPKLACLEVEVTTLGLANDRQRNLKVHGGPERALCLYSLERILQLQAEGHPVFPGAAGENLTLSGLDWDALQPGSRLRIGEQVLIELTRYTVPCNSLVSYFIDKDFSRIHQEKHPGWARYYARVLETGWIKVGDLVEIV
jgi:MOSC domain-containing protein YiiM